LGDKEKKNRRGTKGGVERGILVGQEEVGVEEEAEEFREWRVATCYLPCPLFGHPGDSLPVKSKGHI
jgi:hypothetical protein